MSLWQCPGCAGFLSHFPLSFLSDTDLGAFLCSPSEGFLASFLCHFCLVPGFVMQTGSAPPSGGLGMSWGLLVQGSCTTCFGEQGSGYNLGGKK